MIILKYKVHIGQPNKNSLTVTLSSSSYPVHLTHRKLRLGFGEERKMTAHTHKAECGQRVPRLKKDSQMNPQRKENWFIIYDLALKTWQI